MSATERVGGREDSPSHKTKATYFFKMRYSDGVQVDAKLQGRLVPGWPQIGSMVYVDDTYIERIVGVKYSDHEDQFTIDVFPIHHVYSFDPMKFAASLRRGWKVLRVYGVPAGRELNYSAVLNCKPENVTNMTEAAFIEATSALKASGK